MKGPNDSLSHYLYTHIHLTLFSFTFLFFFLLRIAAILEAETICRIQSIDGIVPSGIFCCRNQSIDDTVPIGILDARCRCNSYHGQTKKFTKSNKSLPHLQKTKKESKRKTKIKKIKNRTGNGYVGFFIKRCPLAV